MLNVLIRPLQIEDAHISYIWRNDSEIWKFTGNRPNKEITLDIEKEWIENILKDNLSKRFAILNKGEYVGNIQLTNLSQKDAEFHVFIGDKNSWGKGIATLATYQILFYAKEILKLDSVYLNVNKNNEAAIKSYLKNGFQKENEYGEQFKMRINLKDLNPPEINVFLMVYNHASYLKTCLDSILNQEVNNNFIINVGEDNSKDESRAILREYQDKFPGKFKMLLHEHNIGAMANQISILKSCNGKYIAMCEGDDYWTSPDKLAKQIEYLENNLDCNLVYHRSEVLDEESGEIELEKLNNPEFPMKRDLSYFALNGNFMHTATVMYRNNFKLPEKLFSGVVGDYILWFLNGEKGLYGYIPDIMSVYRFWGGSTWGKKKTYFKVKGTLVMLKMLKDYIEDINVKNNLSKQMERNIKLLSLKDLSFQEKASFLYLILKVKPNYLLDIFKKLPKLFKN
ncbi:GNAT family N-acetyltransferase [Elizabethkingia anophelis]|uniref:GNAT family N-acetyltransferase n=1 Tax=Elizabethkingia anophelis TaxID=1117645 RepID=UPI00136A2C65|nr:GNAT family N-acetyltransferase [Elizabethkingia anophelis]MCT3720737.1 GNAT family N-acetyltransferase [Elizabethkingia anophelis]MCT3724117.1 GNAT family N-acetyltransferase [Elizabethkingia anophelis]MCT3756467.1 GNAT family N-acetyltransferase [Elizabethkingia anophelis]MCT3777290.1 GNAT family N-acetyltransferase [Elizabethkingia anophelis]MCT3784403.1 GNAT family N-acetyltransferase [Elizabethkingia anophelis]